MPLRDVEGQGRAIEALLRALRGGRLHHAYLFAGPDGVGKGLTAWATAQALLCTQPREDGDACATCAACLRVAERQHPDLHVVERQEKSSGGLDRAIKIDQVRELQRALSFKSFEGARRVVLILEPETMNPSTANALLKTLEEPGAGTHFVLVCASPQLLLPTILSRCQRVQFAPLTREVVQRHLAEKAGLDADGAALLAGLAEGSIGKGLVLVNSEILAQREALIARVDDPDGLRHVPALLDLAEQLAKAKDDLPLVFHLLRTWYRDLLLVQNGLPDEALVHRDLAANLRARATQLRPQDVMARIDLINETEDALARMANTRLSLETLLLRLVGAAPRRLSA